ncbi:MAG: hypothetical protein Q8N60_02080, partial [Candidatus Diapherotrites archaeon]|nr:hypothetical protein [Candidatus Diapherotrites archaeon]
QSQAKSTLFPKPMFPYFSYASELNTTERNKKRSNGKKTWFLFLFFPLNYNQISGFLYGLRFPQNGAEMAGLLGKEQNIQIQPKKQAACLQHR